MSNQGPQGGFSFTLQGSGFTQDTTVFSGIYQITVLSVAADQLELF